MRNFSDSPIKDPLVHEVLAEIRSASKRQPPRAEGAPSSYEIVRDPFDFADYALSIRPEQGDLLYLLCRATGAKRVAECATSHGVSTIYLAAAMRDNGGGLVIGSEIVGEKVERARASLAKAQLSEFADVRLGDARTTFADLGGPIDLLLVDGWPTKAEVSLARSVIELVTPQLRTGAIVINDNGEDDYLAYIHDPANGFISTSIPLKGHTEVSVRV